MSREIAPPYDPGLINEAGDLLRALPLELTAQVLLHRGFNVSNVLAATGRLFPTT
jgi:hypothetical protein